MKASRRRHLPGFTLVEMLVVIVIIVILAGLLIPTIGMAVRRSKNAAIALELDQLSGAVEAYKAKANDYPPDFTNTTAFLAHMRKAYPRNTTNPTAWLASTLADGRQPANLDAAEALPFWLGLISTNPRNPLTLSGESVSYYPFKEPQLVDLDGDGWMEYVPKQAQGAPFVYFDGRQLSGQYTYASPTCTYGGGSLGVVRPYRSNTPIEPTRDNNRTQPVSALNDTQWLEPTKFQIISAGLDNTFGVDNLGPGNELVFKKFPDPNYYISAGPDRTEDEDNLANFSENKPLGDMIP